MLGIWYIIMGLLSNIGDFFMVMGFSWDFNGLNWGLNIPLMDYLLYLVDIMIPFILSW
jgi:hypothetical protein